MQTYLTVARLDLAVSAQTPATTSEVPLAGVAVIRHDFQAPPVQGLNESLIGSLRKSDIDALRAEPAYGDSARLGPSSVQAARSGAPLIDVPVPATATPPNGTLADRSLTFGESIRPPSLDYPSLAKPDFAGRIVTQREANIYIGAMKDKRMITQRDANIYLEAERWARTIHSLVERARKEGLAESEVQKLESILRNSKDFDSDAQVVASVLARGNPARGLRTFNDLDVYRREHPDRITPDVVRALALGVAQVRDGWTEQGYEGVLSNTSAMRAAEALIRMPPADYQAVSKALDNAGNPPYPDRPEAGTDVQTEKALILKAAAARVERLADFTAWNATGEASPACDEITGFAQAICGKDWRKLVELTTAIDFKDDGKATALTQRWTTSCAQATLQIARAEADPVYALWLHNYATLHSRSDTDAIAKEQHDQLKATGANPIAVNLNLDVAASGTSAWAFMESLNKLLSPLTGRTYAQHSVENSAQARRQAVDYMQHLLKTGTDVPISVDWADGGAHTMLVTDVSGAGADRILVTDPGTGQTGWIRCDDIVNGNTSWFGKAGNLTNSFW
jgi:hypothetical protein